MLDLSCFGTTGDKFLHLVLLELTGYKLNYGLGVLFKEKFPKFLHNGLHLRLIEGLRSLSKVKCLFGDIIDPSFLKEDNSILKKIKKTTKNPFFVSPFLSLSVISKIPLSPTPTFY